MEAILRRRDLPSFCRGKELLDERRSETRSSTRASALILNNLEDLEGPVLSHIRSHCPTIYTLGPLQSLLRSKLPAAATSSLREEDRSCVAWLDAQPAKSVVYASFGSYTVVNQSQLMEFWHRLVGSGYRFLWARRLDMVVADDDDQREVPAELVAATRERGCIVEWVPQEEVLNHPAVARFLTHSSWNSMLESIVTSVPMLCWSFFADQQVNSQFVGEVWGVGLDKKDQCDRKTVERMVVALMEGEELQETARRYAGVAAVRAHTMGQTFLPNSAPRSVIQPLKHQPSPQVRNRNTAT